MGPGAASIPTPAFPTLPALGGVWVNALMLKYAPFGPLRSDTLGTRSGRTTEPSSEGSVLLWSLFTLSVGVRYGPVSSSVMVFTFQPPKIASMTGELFIHCRP